MPDESDPPRKFFQLKPTDYEVVNERVAPSASSGSEPTPPDPGPAATAAGRIDVKDLFRQANRPGPALSGKITAKQNDVHAILAENKAHADAAGLNQISARPRRASRRKRDYWALMVVFNALYGLAPFVLGPNPMTLVFGFAGMIISSLGLTWIMWHVMGDY